MDFALPTRGILDFPEDCVELEIDDQESEWEQTDDDFNEEDYQESEWERTDDDFNEEEEEEEEEEECMDDDVGDGDAQVDDGYVRKPNDIPLTLADAQLQPMVGAVSAVEGASVANAQPQPQPQESVLSPFQVASVANSQPPQKKVQMPSQQPQRRPQPQKKVQLSQQQQRLSLHKVSGWVASIRDRQVAEPTRLTTLSCRKSCSIHRVPRCLRRHNENAYDPQIISIGPFHYKKRRGDQLQPMQEHKWRYLNEIIPSISIEGEHEPHGLLDRCLGAIGKLEEKARRCYSEKFDLESNAFVEMMLLDGCFIIEFFRRSMNPTEYRDDPIVKLGWLKSAIKLDLLLLENQIPFFIIESLCKEMGIHDDFLMTWVYPLFVRTTENAPNSTENEAKDHACTFQRPLHSQGCPDHLVDVRNLNEKEEKQKGEQKAPRFKHLLHFVHCIHLPNWVDTSNSTKEEERGNAPKFQHVLHFLPCLHFPNSVDKKPTDPMVEMIIPSASRLQEAGIKFQKGDHLSDIKFKNGVIKIPLLKVKDTTKSVLLNLVAFEQCYRHCNSHFAGYFYFMDCLIDNAKDVQILCEKGIINRWMSSDKEVAALFNKMGREIILYGHDSNLINVCEEINRYYKASWHAWRTTLKRNYFNNPWAIISVVAGIVLLLFTFSQTFFSAFPRFAAGN